MNPTSIVVALSSAIAFALQIALAFLLLRYFSPEEVGTFSVISQIGFFWTTLALAQAPLQLLANHGVSVLEDARLAWIASIKRFIWLLPIAALAVWWSGMSFANTFLWALLLSLCQLTWMLAQSMRLRMTSIWGQVGVRLLSPITTLFAISTAIYFQAVGPILLSAALLGYAGGAAWLLPALTNTKLSFTGGNGQLDEIDEAIASVSAITTDDRTITLRMAHAISDALVATAIVVVWQRLYGAQEAGLLLAPLRLMGFVPAVVHTAWSQVLIARPQYVRSLSCWVGIGGFACVSILGAICALALHLNLLGDQWQGVWTYLLPLILWQGSTCLLAAYSHVQFLNLSSTKFSLLCIKNSLLQLGILLAITVYDSYFGSSAFLSFNLFALTSLIGTYSLIKYLSNQFRS
jgi:hypothetical protein